MPVKRNKSDTTRTFHWRDADKTLRTIEIDPAGRILITLNATSSSFSTNLSIEQFDDLIQYVYSERKKRQLDQQEVTNANP